MLFFFDWFFSSSTLQCQQTVSNSVPCKWFQLVPAVIYLFLLFDNLFDIQLERKVKSTLSLLNITWARAVLFLYCGGSGSEELSELVKSLLQEGKGIASLSDFVTTGSNNCGTGGRTYDITEYSGKALQLVTRWDRIFLFVLELYIFACFNTWYMYVAVPCFSVIEQRRWAVNYSFTFHFLPAWTWQTGWKRKVEVWGSQGEVHLFFSWLAVLFIVTKWM